MTFKDFWQHYVRIGSGDSPTPHREQARYIASVDAGGHREALLHWAKKCAKSFTAAARGLHYLIGEHRDPDDRLIGIASHDEEQSRVIFAQACQMISRHPWLDEHVKVGRNELVYEEEARDPRTGGTFTRVHRLRALTRDPTGLHGEPWSLVLRDETWSEPDHAMSEALIPSPQRAYSEILYTSYSLLATMKKPGVPLFDLQQRVQVGDPTLFYSYIGGEGADASWNVAPWVTESWIDQQRRIFTASPSRFRRVVLNQEVLGGDGETLISFAELDAARDPSLPVEPVRQSPAQYVGGLDLGVVEDHAAFVVGHLDARGTFITDLCIVWKPERGIPISFSEIENAVTAWHRRLKFSRLNIDQWNAKLLAERLQAAGVPAKLVGVEQTRINQIITVIKAAFSKRAIKIPGHCSYLFEQLEALRTLETRTPRRDLLKFAPSGTGPDASQHDDAAIALGLCLIDDRVRDRIGRIVMADHDRCIVEDTFQALVKCPIAGEAASIYPGCRRCPGYESTRVAYEAYLATGAEWMDIGRFATEKIAPNRFVLSRHLRSAMEHHGLL